MPSKRAKPAGTLSPGPWVFDASDGDNLPIVLDANGYQVARVPIRSADGKTTAETDANGRLIAAAPALRDALRAVLEANRTSDVMMPYPIIKQARAALAACEAPRRRKR